MKLNHTNLLLGLLLLVCSCNPNEGSVWNDLNFIRIKAERESLTVSGGKEQLLWNENDAILVFDQDGKSACVTTNDPDKNVFFTYEWTKGEPSYAVFPAMSEAKCTADGVITDVVLQSEQYAGDKYMASVGKVTGNRSAYRLSPMKNVNGMLALTVKTDYVSAIVLESAGNEYLAGNITVNYSKLENEESDFWNPGTKMSRTITLLPSEGKSYFAKGTYYAAILPQTYSEGLCITSTIAGADSRKTFMQTGLTIKPSKVERVTEYLDESSLPSDIETITVSLDFEAGWPFIEPCAQEQTAAGESYTYVCEVDYNGTPVGQILDVKINSGEKSFSTYSYNVTEFGGALCYQWDKTLGADSSYGLIKLPSFDGMYLKTVKIVHRTPVPSTATGSDVNGFYFTLQKSTFPKVNTNSAENEATSRAKAGAELIYNFPGTKFSNAQPGTSYDLRVRFPDMEITKLTLVYTKTKP